MAEVATTKKKEFSIIEELWRHKELTLIQNEKFAVAHNSSS